MPEEKKQKETSHKELKKKFEECKRIRDEYLAGWQRSRANFLNYKKQEVERIENALNIIKADWILKMLEIHDNLERAREHTPKNLKDSDWVKGVLQIENQFHSFFKEQGVERIDPEGKKFDPNFHQAVGEVEATDKESGIIIEVLEKGYLIKGQVLRPAKVKVVK